MIISQNPTFGTTTRLLAPRIEIAWDPATNDGPVSFHLEQLTTKPHPDGWTQTLERFFFQVMQAPIADLVRRSYAITAPATTVVDPDTGETLQVPGETINEPGHKLLLGIKAATRAAYAANVVQPDPDADPIARKIVIIWNPINDNGDVTFQVSDRGTELGVLAESIPNLIAADYVIPQLEGEGTEVFPGWKLKALIKAATHAAIAASISLTSASENSEPAAAEA